MEIRQSQICALGGGYHLYWCWDTRRPYLRTPTSEREAVRGGFMAAAWSRVVFEWRRANAEADINILRGAQWAEETFAREAGRAV